MKLTPFWPENIKTWFVQSESQFWLKGVTVSQTKFDYFIQSMTQEVTVKVLNLIRNPLADNPYQYLNKRLLRMFTLNDYACIEAIANLPLRSRMLGLLPEGHAPCFFLCAAFLKPLPADI